MLRLRPATVVAVLDSLQAEQLLLVELLRDPDAAPGPTTRRPRRAAICDTGLHPRAHAGDRVIVNTAAFELGLGSGGFDVVHVNLTRGLVGADSGDVRVRRGGRLANAMKLNYTSLQHAVEEIDDRELCAPLGRPVAVLALHGQLA